MPRHLWTIVCEKATIDRETNNVSLIEIVEDVSVAVEAQQELSKPLSAAIILPVTWTVVSAFERDDPARGEKADGEMQLVSPSGSILGTALIEIDLTQHARARCLVKFAGWPVPEGGRYLVKVFVRSQPGASLCGEIPLLITLTHSTPQVS